MQTALLSMRGETRTEGKKEFWCKIDVEKLKSAEDILNALRIRGIYNLSEGEFRSYLKDCGVEYISEALEWLEKEAYILRRNKKVAII